MNNLKRQFLSAQGDIYSKKKKKKNPTKSITEKSK